MTKVIGILGGMGPAATLDLLCKIYQTAPATRDQDHLRVLADIDPTVPDRTRAVCSGDSGALARHLAKNARGLAAQGAEVIGIACNTAHVVLPRLRQEIDVPFVDMVEEAARHAAGRSSGVVGLLATDGTLASGLYSSRLKAMGREVLIPEAGEQRQLMEIIYQVKAGSLTGGELVAALFQKLLDRGADVVIAACTELPLLLPEEGKLVDATAALARALVETACLG